MITLLKLSPGLQPRLVAHDPPLLPQMPVDVRFGSKADIEAPPRDVRFSPKSGHR